MSEKAYENFYLVEYLIKLEEYVEEYVEETQCYYPFIGGA